MGLTIRKGLFETNSSSTHALVVSLEKDYEPTWHDVSSGWQEYNFELGEKKIGKNEYLSMRKHMTYILKEIKYETN